MSHTDDLLRRAEAFAPEDDANARDLLMHATALAMACAASLQTAKAKLPGNLVNYYFDVRKDVIALLEKCS